MKNSKTPNQAHVFKIPFSKAIFPLIVAIFLLSAAGIALSTWRILRFGVHSFNDFIKYPFLIAVCVFCIVIAVSVLVKSQYVVDGKSLITQYGFLKSKFPLQDVTSMILNTESKKLTVYFGEQYTVLSVSLLWNEDLVRAVLAVNPNAEYSFTFTDAPKKDNEN